MKKVFLKEVKEGIEVGCEILKKACADTIEATIATSVVWGWGAACGFSLFTTSLAIRFLVAYLFINFLVRLAIRELINRDFFFGSIYIMEAMLFIAVCIEEVLSYF